MARSSLEENRGEFSGGGQSGCKAGVQGSLREAAVCDIVQQERLISEGSIVQTRFIVDFIFLLIISIKILLY
jgi:hypothetical protein